MSDQSQVTPWRLAEFKTPKPKGGNLALLERREVNSQVLSLEEQAARIIRQARDQAAQVEKEAYERGYAQGEKDGRVMGEKRFEATSQGLRKLSAALADVRAGLLREAEEEMARLCLDMAQAIIRAEVSCGPEVALRAIREALASLAQEAAITVRLNPEELAYLKERGLLPEGAKFEPDPKISPGGCLADSERERFDARVERQLERLAELLREEMTRGRGGAPAAG